MAKKPDQVSIEEELSLQIDIEIKRAYSDAKDEMLEEISNLIAAQKWPSDFEVFLDIFRQLQVFVKINIIQPLRGLAKSPHLGMSHKITF